MEQLALASVRKPKAKKTHLTVPPSADADIRTLCGVAMAAGEYEVVGNAADCQPCLRKQHNRAFISSAYFAQDAGTQLLEMSLQQAKAGRKGSAKATSRAGRPKLRVVGSQPEDAAPRQASQSEAQAETPAADRGEGPGPADVEQLGLEALKRVGPSVYQSPAGVLVRLARQGKTWRIAELSFEGAGLVRARSSGRTTVRLGDVEVEPDEEGRLHVVDVG